MVYESSYVSGLKPFRHDTERGSWASPHDFLFICVSNAFKMDFIAFLPMILFYELGILSIIPYFFSLAIFIVPIVIIQSFLGQFSSSGLISVFRIAPLFKGMGYVSLAINLTMLTYYSIFAAIPIVFFFHSFRPTLPWSCEATKSESELKNITTICNYKATELDNETFAYVQVPSVNFFDSHIMGLDVEDTTQTRFSFSWSLFGCMLLVWALVTYIVTNRTETIGKIIRYSVFTVIGILVVCLVRFLFLPGALVGLENFILPNFETKTWLVATPLLATVSFGPGWGTILSMASYNNFKTNIPLYSWIICSAQFVILVLFGLVSFLVEYHFKEISSDTFFHNVENQWVAFLAIPSAIASMELPNFWSMIYFAMLIIGAVILTVVQLFSVLTALFDEFEELRSKKREVTLILIGLLTVGSIYFCSNHGILFFVIISRIAVIAQTSMNFLLLLVVLWIYGRERFQRDIEFMTSQKISTLTLTLMRYVAPIMILLILMFDTAVAIFEKYFYEIDLWAFGIILILVPWLFIPGFGIYNLLQTTGSFFMRFRRCVRPTDWYPADSVDRQKYEEAVGNMEITHQLNEVLE